MKLKTFKSEEEFIKQSLALISRICKKNNGIIRIALSGGATPWSLYKALVTQKNIPFERIEFYQVDERYVPETHADSNQKMIREVLLNPLKGRLKAFYTFDTSIPLQASVNSYESILKKNVVDGFDLVILGIGPDGHTASLFPDSPALKEKKRLVAHTTTNFFSVKDRLTITFLLILKSKKLLVLLKGVEKKAIIQAMLKTSKNISELPARALLKHRDFSIYFLLNKNA